MSRCCSATALLQVRWMSRVRPKPGKPPILPPAKSKRYRVVHVPWQRPEDVKELLWRRHAYNSAVNSIREYYRQNLAGAVSQSSASDAYRQEIEEEFQALLRENDALNEAQAERRAKEEADKRQRIEKEIMAKARMHVKEEAARRAERTAEVLEWIKRSEDFVTLENLDEKIEAALESPVDFNLAMDTDGRLYKGKEPVKYNTENLLLAKRVSEETAALLPAGRLKERSDTD